MARWKRSRRDLSEARGCLPKIRYATWGEAEHACVVTMDSDHARGRRMAHPLLAYRCRYCGCWHVGHSYGPWPDEGVPVEKRFRNSPRLLAQRAHVA